MFSISAITGCNMKYQILRYFNTSCSFGRNNRLSGMGVENFVIKNVDNFRFFLYVGILAQSPFIRQNVMKIIRKI